MSDRLIIINEKGDYSVDSSSGRGIGENLNNLVGDDGFETVVVVRTDEEEEENVELSGEMGDSSAKWGGELGSSKSAVIVNEGKLKYSEDEQQPSCGIGEENLNNLVGNDGSQTVIIVIRSDDESKDLNTKRDELGSGKSVVNEEKLMELEDEQHSCVIDVKCGDGKFGENLEGEKVCRICHLSSERSEGKYSTTSTTTADLIQLGCGCKDELGIAHSHCAEAWFKLRGNRQCEICGEIAKNIKGIGDSRFMEEWNDRRSSGSDATLSSDGGGGCWRGQPFCNFLMACLVIAFVLPWFFRVNMF